MTQPERARHEQRKSRAGNAVKLYILAGEEIVFGEERVHVART